MFNSVHAAKYAKKKELKIRPDEPRTLKMVGYYGEEAFIAC